MHGKRGKGMNGQISDEAKKRPLRNWKFSGKAFYGRSGRVIRSEMTPSESLQIAEIAARIKYGRY
jgi:hypothetical protein